MAEELSDAHIALLCDIAQASQFATTNDNEADVAYLVHAGYITNSDAPVPALQLTEKASTFLSARGATLNEA